MIGGNDEATGKIESLEGSSEEKERQKELEEVKRGKKVFHVMNVC